MNQLSDLRTYCREFEERISNLIEWQDSSKGISSNLPKIEESHKDIVFQEWEIRLKHAEMENFNARYISNNIKESISVSLLQANLISNYPEDTFPDVKLLTKT